MLPLLQLHLQGCSLESSPQKVSFCNQQKHALRPEVNIKGNKKMCLSYICSDIVEKASQQDTKLKANNKNKGACTS